MSNYLFYFITIIDPLYLSPIGYKPPPKCSTIATSVRCTLHCYLIFRLHQSTKLVVDPCFSFLLTRLFSISSVNPAIRPAHFYINCVYLFHIFVSFSVSFCDTQHRFFHSPLSNSRFISIFLSESGFRHYIITETIHYS